MADFALTLSRCALAYDWHAAFNQTVQLAVYQGHRWHKFKTAEHQNRPINAPRGALLRTHRVFTMFTSLITVAVLHWLALLSPGPNVLLVTHMAAHGQRKAALYAAAGITIAGCVWAGIAISGVSAIFSAHNTARLLFQTIGGIYLAYIGWRIASKSSAKDLERSVALSAAGAFRLGLTTNALNPKAALFFASIFTAALPANADAGFVAACVIVVFVNALAWHVLLALAFSHPAVQRAYALHQSLLCKVAGTLVALFGIRLIVLAVLEWVAR